MTEEGLREARGVLIGTALPSIRGRHAALTFHLAMMHRKKRKEVLQLDGRIEDQDQELRQRKRQLHRPSTTFPMSRPYCARNAHHRPTGHGRRGLFAKELHPAVPFVSVAFATPAPRLRHHPSISGSQRCAQPGSSFPRYAFPGMHPISRKRCGRACQGGVSV